MSVNLVLVLKNFPEFCNIQKRLQKEKKMDNINIKITEDSPQIKIEQATPIKGDTGTTDYNELENLPDLSLYEPANSNIQNHIISTSNPHSVTKLQVGLENCDNTTDLNKPVSNAMQTALNSKPTVSSGSGVPSSTPAKIGDIYIDTTNSHTYIAKDTSSSADWIKQNGSYVLQLGTAIGSPIDTYTYYFGLPANAGVSNNASIRQFTPPKSGTITRAEINISTDGTLGTNETSSLYLRLNNTTDYLLSNTISHNSQVYKLSKTGLNIPIVNTDNLVLKFLTPTWTTNPTSVYFSVTLLVDLQG